VLVLLYDFHNKPFSLKKFLSTFQWPGNVILNFTVWNTLAFVLNNTLKLFPGDKDAEFANSMVPRLLCLQNELKNPIDV